MNEPKSGVEDVMAMETDIASVLHRYIRSGYDSIELNLSRLRGMSQGYAQLHAATGHTAGVDVEPSVVSLMRDIRKAMYQPSKGTWLSVKVKVDKNGHYRFSYNYDDEAKWAIPPATDAYARDLEMFPRDEQHIPGWLKERLGQVVPSTT